MKTSFHLIVCLGIFLFASDIWAQESVRLEDSNWKISLQDSKENAAPDFDDSRWENVTIPGNLIQSKAYKKRKKQKLWLRYHLTADIYSSRKNLALVLGRVFDQDEVYFNGKKIGPPKGEFTRGKLANNYGRSRIYPIPMQSIRRDENIIAIKIRGSFDSSLGITRGPVRILPHEKAVRIIWKRELSRLIFVAIYIVAGLFFLILYQRLPQLKEYKWFGIFALIFGLLQFLLNEIRFEIAEIFLVYKFVEQICYLMLPAIYFNFFVYFFKIKEIPFIRWSPRKVAGAYGVFNFAFVLLFAIFFDPVTWSEIITYWFISVLPAMVFYLYHTIKQAITKFDRDAIILMMGTIIMTYFTIDYWGVEHVVWAGPSYFDEGLFIFFLSIAFALIFRLIEMQLEVNDRRSRLGSVDLMQDRVFNYLNLFLNRPTEQIVRYADVLSGREKAENYSLTDSEILPNMQVEVDGLQTNLDDILELSRLEVISEPEFLEPVNFFDFISAVIPSGKITHYIKVNPDIILNTSLELVNSFVVRVIDFPPFVEFQNIDLIITSDLEERIHFRFMLFHTNVRKTRHLHDLLTEMNPERGEIWVKWAIIREIIRILNGNLEVRIVNRKFLRIDIQLAAELPQNLKEKQGGTIALLPGSEEGTVVASPGQHSEMGRIQTIKMDQALPRLHSKMTVSEFINHIKLRIRNRN